MNLGEVIRITRQKAFYTQEDFAQELKVSLSTVNRWEVNKAKPSLKTMKAIKQFCDSKGLSYTIIENEWLNYSKEET